MGSRHVAFVQPHTAVRTTGMISFVFKKGLRVCTELWAKYRLAGHLVYLTFIPSLSFLSLIILKSNGYSARKPCYDIHAMTYDLSSIFFFKKQ